MIDVDDALLVVGLGALVAAVYIAVGLAAGLAAVGIALVFLSLAIGERP